MHLMFTSKVKAGLYLVEIILKPPKNWLALTQNGNRVHLLLLQIFGGSMCCQGKQMIFSVIPKLITYFLAK